MQNQVLRLFHSGVSCWSSSLNKSLLSKLRKKTGFTFSNCRKALEVNDNNIEKAEKWLQEQAQALGWSKLSKLEGRVTAQGMVGIAIDGKSAAMIEVNCETDFVARNKNFREMINLVSSSCLHHAKMNKNKTEPICKEFLDTEQMKSLNAPDGKLLADHVALLVSSVGENVSLRRAVCIAVKDNYYLAGYAHPGSSEENNIMSGKYGALLMYSALNSNVTTQHTSRQLCQHVVGMNPKTIEKEETDANNNETGDAKSKVTAAMDQKHVEIQQNPETEQEEEFTNDDDIENNEETAILSQDFLMDPTVTVKQVASEAGITIHDFIRFETGEKLQEEIRDPEPKFQQMRG